MRSPQQGSSFKLKAPPDSQEASFKKSRSPAGSTDSALSSMSSVTALQSESDVDKSLQKPFDGENVRGDPSSTQVNSVIGKSLKRSATSGDVLATGGQSLRSSVTMSTASLLSSIISSPTPKNSVVINMEGASPATLRASLNLESLTPRNSLAIDAPGSTSTPSKGASKTGIQAPLPKVASTEQLLQKMKGEKSGGKRDLQNKQAEKLASSEEEKERLNRINEQIISMDTKIDAFLLQMQAFSKAVLDAQGIKEKKGILSNGALKF
jgi:hypothetical protein